jgi:4-hydroxymandelate oxidase
VEASGYISVCLTVDTQLYSRRERDIVNRYSPRQAMSFAPNPRGPDSNYQARLTWADVEWLKKTTRLPLGLKGIMTVRDAKRAIDTGVEVIWVSNHGGRQLDHTQATIDGLPAIVDAVGGRAAIVIDGGFRRGTDVIKAVALGANVVAMGRAILWGLAADGADGVASALDILRQELRTSMGLSGQTSVRGLRPDSIFKVEY